MKKNNILKKTIVSMFILSISSSFIGCQESTLELKDPKAKIKEEISSISGMVIDGIIEKGIVCIDINENMLCDEDESSTTTNELGEYILKLPEENEETKKYTVLSYGGIDKSSGKKFEGILAAPVDIYESKTNLNPFTTIIHSYLKKEKLNYESKNLQNAYNEISDKLGLNQEILQPDFYINYINEPSSTKIVKEMLKYQKLFEIINYIENEEDNYDNKISILYNLHKIFLNSNKELFNYETFLNEVVNDLDFKNTKKAKEILEKVFPKQVIEQIRIDGIASGGGSIHCATQQEPKDKIRG